MVTVFSCPFCSKYIAILCSFLLGLGDSSFNTQIYSLIGFMFPEDSSPAFAIFKFIQVVREMLHSIYHPCIYSFVCLFKNTHVSRLTKVDLFCRKVFNFVHLHHFDCFFCTNQLLIPYTGM